MGNEDDLNWKSVSHTHVEYPKGDNLGKILAYSSLSPIFILVGFVTHIYFRREIHTITFLIGQLLNEVFNQILKHVVKEARPPGPHKNLSNIYGWPSAHSQFVWFFVTYLLLFIYFRSQRNNSTLDTLWRVSMFFLCVAFAVCVSYSRVYLLYHTTSQVMWGLAIGCSTAVLWFGLTQLVFTPFFPTIANTRIAELFLVRDSTLIPNIMWFEYTTSRQESRSRLRQLQNKSQ